MNNINEIISKNFNDNIEYIQKFHNELFEKLSALDSAVSNGHYKEKYELVFENGAFDVIEIGTQNRLYNGESKKHTQLAQDSVNGRLDNSLFECFVRQDGKKEISYATPVIKKISQLQEQKDQLDEFGKFIFFGVGLGLHIESVDKKIQAKHYLIVEDDLELFRLSLFCINYKTIAQNSIITFAVFEDNNSFLEISERFLQREYYLNHYIKYFQLLSHSDEKYNQFHLAVTTQAHIRFLFSDLLESYIRPLEYFSKGYNILQKSINFKNKKFTDRPFLFIASGPSLQENIEWLKESKNHFTIVSASSSLSFLQKHNVSVDIVLHIDPFIESKVSIDKLGSMDFIKDSILFLHSGVHQEFLKIFNKRDVYLLEMGTNYVDSSFKLSGPCVGSAGLLLMILLKIQDVYLLGLDLAIDSQTGKDHTDTHQSTKILSVEENAFDNQMSYKDNVFEVDGNFDRKVLTTPHFFSSIEIINRYYAQLKESSQNIYNLSSGAKYNIAIPKKVKDINLKGYKKFETNFLKEIVSSYSKNVLQADDIKRIKVKIKNSKYIYKNIKNYSYHSGVDTVDYMHDIIGLANIEDNKDVPDEIVQIIDSFLRYVLEYIYDFFNSTTSSESKSIIDKTFREEMLRLIQTYISSLENIVKE